MKKNLQSPKRVVIGGCRYYHNYEDFSCFVDFCLSRIKKEHKIIILSGHCTGVDMMAERYAKENKFDLEIYPAEWDKYGKSAGPRRNREMVLKADFIIAFWDGKSRGTHSLIDYASNFKKPFKIYRIS